VLEEGRTLLLVNPQHIKVKQAKESNFRDVKRLAAGLERDQEEILFGLTLVYSNGRASFSLLRQRVLYAF